MIKYLEATDIKKLIIEIVNVLGFSHIESQHIYCFRSVGSKSKHTIARIYGLNKIWQESLQTSPAYVIEVISERYDHLNKHQKVKTLIHELLHIPLGFSGGFRPHKGYIDEKKVERLYIELQEKKRNNLSKVLSSERIEIA